MMMQYRSLRLVSLRGAVMLFVAAALLSLPTIHSASAQSGVVEGGLLGAGAGAIIGGIAGGGRGAAKGAIIGGAAGAIIGGAAEAERRRYQGPPPQAAYYGPAPMDPLVYDTQTSLARLGYNPGPIDGVYGPRTANAIAAYERDHGLMVTGQPSPELLNHMIQRGG